MRCWRSYGMFRGDSHAIREELRTGAGSWGTLLGGLDLGMYTYNQYGSCCRVQPLALIILIEYKRCSDALIDSVSSMNYFGRFPASVVFLLSYFSHSIGILLQHRQLLLGSSVPASADMPVPNSLPGIGADYTSQVCRLFHTVLMDPTESGSSSEVMWWFLQGPRVVLERSRFS
jgi:hypothetical protein